MASVQDLVTLGLLMDRPLHGYEIKQIVADQMSQVAKISPGTIYYTLKKLEKRGLVTRSAERQGNRPERQVFSLTSEGRDVFRRLLRESLVVEERPYFVFDAAVYFYKHIAPGDLEQAIEGKLGHVEDFRRQLGKLEADNPGRWPFHLEALKRKGFIYASALEEWLLYLRRGLEKRKIASETEVQAL